jgi:hypothetical protein
VEDIHVYVSHQEGRCVDCGEELAVNSWSTLQGEKGALCLTCSDLDHLIFLPAGDAALTRRSRKHSRLSAVVLSWSKRRKRYERQGILVEEAALEKAEVECLADESERQAARERAAVRRAELDTRYVAAFAQKIRELYPNCPDHRETEIALHACCKYSGRVGRSARAKELNPKAVRLAVMAHIRHQETEYDELLTRGCNRSEARERVGERVNGLHDLWAAGAVEKLA